jgi:hypothetical protein
MIRFACALALSFGMTTERASAQGSFLVTLAEGGRVVVNEATLYDLDAGSTSGLTDQTVAGSTLWHLRADGQVFENGSRSFANPVSTLGGLSQWIKVATDGAGNVFCLESSGRQTQQGAVIADLPNENGTRRFVDMEFYDQALWSLRDDGKVYRGGVEFYSFQANPASLRTTFIALTVDSATNNLYAIRRDGEVWRGPITVIPSTPDLIGDFPSNTPDEDWVDVLYDNASSALWAIRRDGVVFRMPIPGGSGIAYVVFDGDGIEGGGKEFRSLAVANGEPIAVRYDGRVYRGTQSSSICDFKGDGYIAVEIAAEQPVIGNAKIFKPVVSTYKTSCSVGDLVEFPVLVSSLSSESFTFTVVELPPWASFNAGSTPPLFSGTPDVEGNFSFELAIDDGLNGPKTYKYKIQVRAADTDPLKNKKPKFQKLKKVQAITGEAITIPLRAYDADGDPLIYSVGEMPEGMTFDDGGVGGTPSVTWTPPICAGSWKIEILASEGKGAKPIKGKLQIDVLTALRPPT